MAVRSAIEEYVGRAMSRAVYTQHADGTFACRVPGLKGVIAFAATRAECERELRSVLADWVQLGLDQGHPIPVIDGIDLNAQVG